MQKSHIIRVSKRLGHTWGLKPIFVKQKKPKSDYKSSLIWAAISEYVNLKIGFLEPKKTIDFEKYMYMK